MEMLNEHAGMIEMQAAQKGLHKAQREITFLQLKHEFEELSDTDKARYFELLKILSDAA